MVTGDGDSLSIGGNHLIHALRRNVPVKILLFNNQIYGLTKGQASPTSELGKITKSTPFGVSDHPFNPVALALGAEATFVARTIDRDRQHLTEVLRAAASHEGAALVEIYQNCPVFNDGAFAALTDKDVQGRSIRSGSSTGARSASAPTAASGVGRARHGGLEIVDVADPRVELLVHDSAPRRSRGWPSRSPGWPRTPRVRRRSASSATSSGPSTGAGPARPPSRPPTTSSRSFCSGPTPGRSPSPGTASLR